MRWYPTPFSSDAPLPIPRDPQGVQCTRFVGCSGSGGHVAQCLYDGQHGSWFPLGDQLLVWFFLNQSAV